ncbi:hypothetical protein [Brevundimonas sp. P7753]|uniref:hypothetical protein n=1 Tax=Brevundimonas sp. P7753 TaxID=2726982 RepID=UPI0015C0D463|nr:hypothetical protein [Brevundimonas sp. P7753]NWE53772.1 hypothetical protein [Brevundimonas sp. P7753]
MTTNNGKPPVSNGRPSTTPNTKPSTGMDRAVKINESTSGPRGNTRSVSTSSHTVKPPTKK